jgi:HEPN domain-containing protein
MMRLGTAEVMADFSRRVRHHSDVDRDERCMKPLTKQWIKKAEADFRVASVFSRGRDRFYNQVCFHCQQLAEKYLKALMVEAGLTVPESHDLDELRTILPAYDASLRPLRRGLVFLTKFDLETRDPLAHASKRDVAAAIRWATRIRDVCRELLRGGEWCTAAPSP